MPRLPIALPLEQQVRCDCGSTAVVVIDTDQCADGSVRRRRQCKACRDRITTQEIRVPDDEWPDVPRENHRAEKTSPREPGKCACGNDVRSIGQRTCRDCHAIAMRAYRRQRRGDPERSTKLAILPAVERAH